jgi:hypothetical protein
MATYALWYSFSGSPRPAHIEAPKTLFNALEDVACLALLIISLELRVYIESWWLWMVLEL